MRSGQVEQGFERPAERHRAGASLLVSNRINNLPGIVPAVPIYTGALRCWWSVREV